MNAWRVRAALAALAVAVMTAVTLVPVGFNASDDGFVVAQAARLLDGEVPHRDFFSPRPVGSALLHTVELIAPTPTLATSRLLVMAQLVLVVWLALAMSGVPRVLRWGTGMWAVTTVSSLTSIHTFPLMAWHTIDGVLVSVVALYCVSRGTRSGGDRWLFAAGLAAGYATVIKQSFAPIPVVVVALFLAEFRHENPLKRPGRGLLALAAAMVVPWVMYLVPLAAFGGLGTFLDQVFGGTGVDAVAGIEARVGAVWVLMGVVGVAGIATTVVRNTTRVLPDGADRFILAAAWCSLAVGAWAAIADRLVLGGSWATVVFWATWAASSLVALSRGHFDPRSLALLAVAWTASLSWGYSTVALGVGPVVAYVLVDTWRASRDSYSPSARTQMLLRCCAGGVAAMMVLWVVDVRHTSVYRDVSASEATYSIGRRTEALGFIKTGRVNAAIVEAGRECIQGSGASRAAVLPDGAGIPSLLGVRNPLPGDWWFTPEIPRDRDRLLDRVAQLDDEGDYIVLIQHFDMSKVHFFADVPAVSLNGTPFDHPDGMVDEISAALSGRREVCGPYIAIIKD